jgi:hypothetical protein
LLRLPWRRFYLGRSSSQLSGSNSFITGWQIAGREQDKELESRLREILEKARDWQRVPVKSSPGIFVVKAPGTKRNPPSLLIELNPVDENNLPTKRRGLYIRSRRDLEEYRKLINDRSLDALVSALEEVNGRREEEEEEPEGLEI